ncbi:MAG: glycosyltransferase [Pyrinomonadaceae bacterium]|nr:glycosyltransferase [Pyrinomonadaceae bacterium]
MKETVIIMVKVPVGGDVKTRMQPYISKAQSAELATALLKDAEERVASTNCEPIIAYTPAHHKKRLKAILPQQHILIEQEGTDLGERMHRAFEYAFQVGFESVVMIGTDSPTFPREFIARAFRKLGTGSDIVIGESEDGGFYLLGLKSAGPGIFDGVEWGSPRAFAQTKRNAEMQKLLLDFLPIWYDVDLPADLERLKHELVQNPDLAPHTSEWLKNI